MVEEKISAKVKKLIPVIEKMTEAELVELQNQVATRIKFFREVELKNRLSGFEVDDVVSFQPEGQPTLKGMITKFNRKTIVVVTENGQHWNLSPAVLTKERNEA
jgi:hypothetical protein